MFLANAYIDLGTWWCITPFIGAGVGGAYHAAAASPISASSPTAAPASAMRQKEFSKWNLAWAVHAGLAYNVTNNFKLELAYRYLNMGDVQTADHRLRVRLDARTGGPRAFYTLTNFDFAGHQARHALDAGSRTAPVYAPPPLIAPRLNASASTIANGAGFSRAVFVFARASCAS